MTQQEINSTSMLRIGTILRGTYRIDSYLSSGGFGNTYIATNIEFDERYAVKEFFMKGITQRDDNQITVSVSNSENTNSFLEQREKFKKEARRLRQFNNQHIIRVHDMFEENGTAYYVMDYVDGENLSDRLKRTGCPMTESEVNLIFSQILDALKTVHDAGMWHLDLKPANIMLGKDGKIKIIDFGASKQLNVKKGGATTSTAISYTNGYAPREQMEQNYDKFGPWTDLYALGATLYNLLSNRRPPLPTDIDDDMTDDKHLAIPLPEDVSSGMKSLVLWLMQTNRMRRPQSIDELTHKLSSLWSDSSKPQNGVKDNEETIVASPKVDMDEETVIEVPTCANVTEESNIKYSQIEKEKSSNVLKNISVIGGIILAFWIIYSITQSGNENSLQANPVSSNTSTIVPNSNTIQSNTPARYEWSGNYTAFKDAGNTYGGSSIFFETFFSLKKVRDNFYSGTMEISGYQTYSGVAKIEGHVYENRIKIFFVSSNDEGPNNWSRMGVTPNTPLLTLTYKNGDIEADWFAAMCGTGYVDQETKVIKD